MKLSISITALVALSATVEGRPDFQFSFDGVCNFDNADAAAADEGKVLADMLDTDEAGARMKVEKLCNSAMELNSSSNSYPFEQVTDKGWQFDSNYYDGGTYLNEEYEPEEIPEFIDNVYEGVAQTQLITYPEDHIEKNFGSCQAQSVMCCWVQDRQANDNNGNCEDDDCKDADPADNTDICWVDLESSPGSNHVENGFALFEGDSEGDAHCHGFAWSNEEDTDTTSYRYRGNVLFYVSMYDHLSQRGYVREVPGAPMCACLEQMPAVSESDCTEMDITETYTFSIDGGGNAAAKITSVDIEYNACTNNELRDRFDELTEEGFTTEETRAVFDKRIVQDCDDNNVMDSFLESKGFKYI